MRKNHNYGDKGGRVPSKAQEKPDNRSKPNRRPGKADDTDGVRLPGEEAPEEDHREGKVQTHTEQDNSKKRSQHTSQTSWDDRRRSTRFHRRRPNHRRVQ